MQNAQILLTTGGGFATSRNTTDKTRKDSNYRTFSSSGSEYSKPKWLPQQTAVSLTRLMDP